jgi:hypothetical protein
MLRPYILRPLRSLRPISVSESSYFCDLCALCGQIVSYSLERLLQQREIHQLRHIDVLDAGLGQHGCDQ